MTEKTARKLGEVLAFANVALDTAERGREAMAAAFGTELPRYEDVNQSHVEIIKTIADKAGSLETVMIKAEKTGDKLMAMRDLYIKDEWDNPTELLEWSGFFEGAAIVHWQLVSGAAAGLSDGELATLAGEAIGFHSEMLVLVSDALRETGLALEEAY